MIDADLVRQKIELVRQTMEAIGPNQVAGRITRLQLKVVQEHCSAVIQAIQALLNGARFG